MKGWTAAHLPGAEQPATPQRTNRGNDGRQFEAEVEATLTNYALRGILSGQKVSPPVRIIWKPDPSTGKSRQIIIQMKNPYLDYLAVWTARHGRALFVEAKSTSVHRLAVNRDAGLKEHQVENMYRWRKAGAAVALLWKFNGTVCLWTPEMIQRAIAMEYKSLRFDEGLPVASEGGLWDFLPVLEKALWP